MTGSITNDAMKASIENLGMQRCVQISGSLDRPNLIYEVKQKHRNRGDLVTDIAHLAKYCH